MLSTAVWDWHVVQTLIVQAVVSGSCSLSCNCLSYPIQLPVLSCLSCSLSCSCSLLLIGSSGCLAQEMVPQPGGLLGALAALGSSAAGGTKKRRAAEWRQSAAPPVDNLAEVGAWPP